MQIGWIGMGRMGYAMALRLLQAGHPLRVWNRTRSKAEALAAHGATRITADHKPGFPDRIELRDAELSPARPGTYRQRD